MLDVENWQVRIESGIMIVLFGAVLVQACRTTRVPYIVGLSVVFMVANTFQLISAFFTPTYGQQKK